MQPKKRVNNLKKAFPGQFIDEPVFIFARPFPIIFIPIAAIFLFIIGISAIAQFYLATSSLIIPGIDPAWMITILGSLQIFFASILMIAIFDFYFDILIVTDRRMVDIDQEQVFYRKISELSLEDIEDASSVVSGFLGTMFNYGRIEVQTAGQKSNFIYDNIRYPREITSIVLDLADQAKERTPDNARFPNTAIFGVIEGKAIDSIADLKNVGAITNDDLLTRKVRNVIG